MHCRVPAAVCIGGYGSWTAAGSNNISGPSCSLCPANTYAPHGGVGPCANCPSGQYSPPGSDSTADCHDEWQRLRKDFDYLPVAAAAADALLVVRPGSWAAEADCKLACGTANPPCVFYQWNANSQQCAPHQPPAAATADAAGNGTAAVSQIGMKIDVDLYAVYAATAVAVHIGESIPPGTATVVVSSMQECTKKCDILESCVVVHVSSTEDGKFACGLRAGGLSPEHRSMYRLTDGSIINSWFSV